MLSFMTDAEFEQLVAAGIDAIPKKFLDKLENVAVVIADRPSKGQRKRLRLGHGWTLYGLYEGIPLPKRGDTYGGLVLPDKITIFKQPILDEAGDDLALVKKIVTDTVWHEIAHYFGFEEDRIHKREADGKNYSEDGEKT